MKKTRAHFVMVPEDDPQWLRFWNAYPRRVSKKDARKAWASLNPSPALVDRIIAALAWQVPHFRWEREKWEFAPYPASWLNGAKWEDEPPRGTRPVVQSEPQSFENWMERVGYCPHKPTCEKPGGAECRQKNAAVPA